MATNCKLVFGYVDHTNEWRTTDVFYRHYDGYMEAIIPLLKEHKADVTTMNNVAEYDGHKWEQLESLYDGVTNVDYIYYIDISTTNRRRCTVVGVDMEYWRCYNLHNYEVKQVFLF